MTESQEKRIQVVDHFPNGGIYRKTIMDLLHILAKQNHESINMETVGLTECVSNAAKRGITAFDKKRGIDLDKCGVSVIGHPDAVIWHPHPNELQQWFTLLKEEQCRAIRILISSFPEDLVQNDADHVLDMKDAASNILKILKGAKQ